MMVLIKLISIIITLDFLIYNNVIIKAQTAGVDEEDGGGESGRYYTIEGRVFPLSDYQLPNNNNNNQQQQLTVNNNWQAITRIQLNSGDLIGFVRKDGSFSVQNVPSGSYVLEVLHPVYTFEPVRVEINSKGKFRARKLNHIQATLVVQVPYPLKMKPLGRTRYFQMREEWRVTDFVFNPMVLMMVLPLLLVMVLPKMLNDPETKKEMEQIQSLTKFELPEVSDMVSNFLAGPAPQQQQGAVTGGNVVQEKNNKKTSKTNKKKQ